eukprot:518549-Pelagomonas_calceolata.AAC.1
MDKLQTKRPEFERTRLCRQEKQHRSLIGGMGKCMGVFKGRPNPVTCLGETTESTYLLKRFKQGNATDTYMTCALTRLYRRIPFLNHYNASITVDAEN